MNKRSNRWHAMQTEDVLRAFSTNRYRGLSSRDAAARRLKSGNSLLWSTIPSDHTPSLLYQICDYTTLLFLLTVVLTAILSHWAESVAVAVLMIVSVALRVIIILATRKISRQNARYMRPRCRVMRDGKSKYLFAEKIVAGDILLLSAGDTVPADARLISGNLTVSEVHLENDRRQVNKSADERINEDAHWTDRANIVYAASTVLRGDCVGVAVAAGESTLAYAVNGRIPMPKEETPSVLRYVSSLSRAVSLCMMVICGVYLVMGLFAKGSSASVDRLFLSAMALVVSSASELLGTIASGALSNAMQRLSTGEGCIVKSCSIVEKLAKTEWLVIGGEHLLQSGQLFIHSWCDGELRIGKNATDNDSALGLPGVCGSIECCFPNTDTLMASVSSEAGTKYQDIIHALKKSHMWPAAKADGACMESVVCNGMHTSLVANDDGVFVYICGSVDDVISCCSRIMGASGPRTINSNEIAAIRAYSHESAAHARKTIAVAKRVSPLNHLDRPASLQNSMIFLGCIAVENPVDENVSDLVARCREGGVRIALLCDDPQEAEYIARKTGILADTDVFCNCDIHKIEACVSETDTGNLIVRSAGGMMKDIIRGMQKHSRHVVYIGDRLADISVAGVCTTVVSERNKERIIDAISRKSDAILMKTDTTEIKRSRSSAHIALLSLSECRNAIVNLRWIVIYLLLSQSFRCVVALFALCADMPLLSSSHTLLLGCLIDMLAVCAMSFRSSGPDALSVKRELIRIPRLKSGLIASVGIGVLAGLILPLALYVLSRHFALFDPGAVSLVRLTGAAAVSGVATLLCSSHRSFKSFYGHKLSVAELVYGAAVVVLLGVLTYFGITKYQITDAVVWGCLFIPAAVTGIMLKLFKVSQ